MKKLNVIICVLLLAVIVLPMKAFALIPEQKDTQIIYFEDGSSLTIELQISGVEMLALMPKTASKVAIFKNSNGVEQWKATLTGTFAYDGTFSTCSASSINVTISNDEWYMVSKNADKNGNTATGSLTMNRKLLGVIIGREHVELSITCDERGNIS